jgi:hypothetical protein
MFATQIISIQPLPDVTDSLNSDDNVDKHKLEIRRLLWPGKNWGIQTGEKTLDSADHDRRNLPAGK